MQKEEIFVGLFDLERISLIGQKQVAVRARKLVPHIEGGYRPINTFLCLTVAAIGGALCVGCDRWAHSSDSILIQRFNQNESDFERLLAMMRVDRQLVRVDDDWTGPPDPSSIGVSTERITEYRRLFAKLGIPRGINAFHYSHYSQEFYFIASTAGIVPAGSTKVYAYFSIHKPEQIVDNLYTYRPQGNRSKFNVYRHIN